MKAICFLLVCIGLPLSIHAQTTNQNIVRVNHSLLKIKDIFPDAIVKENYILGSAPAPGSEFIISEAQLKSIAHDYVDSQTVSSIAGEIIVKRDGVPLSKDIIITFLKRTLYKINLAPHAALSLVNPQLPEIPENIIPKISLIKASYNSTFSKFLATLSVSALDMKTIQFDVVGVVCLAKQAIIATHSIQPNEVLNMSDITTNWMSGPDVSNKVLTDPSQVYGKRADHFIAKGSPVLGSLLKSVEAVKKGAVIVLSVQVPGLRLTSRGVALADGKVGSIISVLNSSSHNILEALVTGKNQAQIDPDSVPIADSVSHHLAYQQTDSYYTRRHHS